MAEPILIGHWVYGDSNVGVEFHTEDISTFSLFIFEKKNSAEAMMYRNFSQHNRRDIRDGRPSMAAALFTQKTILCSRLSSLLCLTHPVLAYPCVG